MMMHRSRAALTPQRIRSLVRCLSTVKPVDVYRQQNKQGTALRTGYTHFFNKTAQDRSEAAAFRQLVREQKHNGQTSGYVPGFVQANFVALPREYAFDFTMFALRNPQACPLLDITQPGDFEPVTAAPGADVRKDIPKYCIYRDGELVEEVNDVTDIWTDDMVGFLLGCSFSWEQVLADNGLKPRHVEEGKNVPMFRSNIKNVRSGPFEGELVVSMRPYEPRAASEASRITSRYPGAHGGPVHWGSPEEIGVAPSELGKPEWGDAVTLKPDEVPVFWACGVTPQTAIMKAKLPLVITHAPGHMFICDLMDSELEVDPAN